MNIKIRELLTLHFLNDGVRATFLILLPFLTKDFSLSYTFAGFLGSSLSLIGAFLALPAGFLTARIGGFRLMLSLLLIYSVASFALALSPNALFLTTAFFFGALGFGMFHTLGLTLIARTSQANNIGRIMGDFTSIGEIGRIAIPPLAIYLTSLFGWRVVMTLLAAIGIFIFVVFHYIETKRHSRDVRKLEEKNEGYKDFFQGIMELFKRKKFLVLAITGLIDSLASSPIQLYLPFLLFAKGVTPALLSILMGAFFVGSLVGKTLLGRSVDYFGNKRVFIVSEICMALVLIAIPLSSSFPLLFLLSFLIGCFAKGTSPVIQTMFSQLTHKNHYHKVYAVTETLLTLAGFITILTMGIIADTLGISYVFYICALLGAFAVVPLFTTQKIPSTTVSS